MLGWGGIEKEKMAKESRKEGPGNMCVGDIHTQKERGADFIYKIHYLPLGNYS